MPMLNINNELKDEQYFTYYKIQNETTLYALAKAKNVNPTLLSAMNGLEEADFVYKDQTIMIPKNNYAFYITKEGDTLETVTQTFDTNIKNILRDNEIIYLHQGQLIVHRTR